MSINSLLTDTGSKSWADLYVDTLTCYSGLKVNGEVTFGEGVILLKHIESGPPNTFLHTNLLNEVVWEPIDTLNSDVDPEQITGGANGQILRYQSPNGTQWFDKILNSNLPDSVIIVNSATIGSNLTANNITANNNISAAAGISAAGTISATTLAGSLAQTFITAGNNNDYLRTIGGIPTWVASIGQQGFRAQLSSSFALSTLSTNLVFDDDNTVGQYNNGEYNTTTGRFTLPAGGTQRWHLDVQVTYAHNGIHTRLDNELVVTLNNSIISTCNISYPDNINDNIVYQTSFNFQGTTGNFIDVIFNSDSNSTQQVLSGTDRSHISAYRIL